MMATRVKTTLTFVGLEPVFLLIAQSLKFQIVNLLIINPINGVVGFVLLNQMQLSKNCLFSGQVSTKGGVIDANHSTLILESCEFSNNSSTLEGGVLNSINSEVNATNCVFSSNQNTENNGAGVANVEGGSFSDVNGSYINNQSLSQGGAIYAECNSNFFEYEFSK